MALERVRPWQLFIAGRNQGNGPILWWRLCAGRSRFLVNQSEPPALVGWQPWDGGWGEVLRSFGAEIPGREKTAKKMQLKDTYGMFFCPNQTKRVGHALWRTVFSVHGKRNEFVTSALRTVNGENGQIGAIVDVRFVVRSRFQGDCSLWGGGFCVGRMWTFCGTQNTHPFLKRYWNRKGISKVLQGNYCTFAPVLFGS